MLETIQAGGQVVGIRLGGEDFVAEDERGEVMVPRVRLTGFRLSEIPEGVLIKPVERIEGNTIYQGHDYAISRFGPSGASIEVEDMERRKYWDGDVGILNHTTAMRDAIREVMTASGWTHEIDFQDDGDYILLHYAIDINDDLPIEDAIFLVESRIAELQDRRDVILRRRTDLVTDLLDRGSFNAELDHLDTIRHHREQSFAVIMVDIDHFRAVNQRIGHPEADRILRAVANHLRDTVRACGGEAFRYGGEELVALLPGAVLNDAHSAADRFRQIVEMGVRAGDAPVTVSCGVARYPDHGATVHGVLTAADAALYRAKDNGRNRVMVAETPAAGA